MSPQVGKIHKAATFMNFVFVISFSFHQAQYIVHVLLFILQTSVVWSQSLITSRSKKEVFSCTHRSKLGIFKKNAFQTKYCYTFERVHCLKWWIISFSTSRLSRNLSLSNDVLINGAGQFAYNKVNVKILLNANFSEFSSIISKMAAKIVFCHKIKIIISLVSIQGRGFWFEM